MSQALFIVLMTKFFRLRESPYSFYHALVIYMGLYLLQNIFKMNKDVSLEHK